MSATREDNMRKLIALAVVLAFGFMPVFTGTVLAQKTHAPKAVWKGMIANLSDIQGITAALAVFDMKRAAMFADSLAARDEVRLDYRANPQGAKKEICGARRHRGGARRGDKVRR